MQLQLRIEPESRAAIAIRILARKKMRILETLARTGRQDLPTLPKYCQVPSTYTSIRLKRTVPVGSGVSAQAIVRPIVSSVAEESADYLSVEAAIWQFQLKFSTRLRSTERLHQQTSTGSFVRRRTRGCGTNPGARKVPRRQHSDRFHQPDRAREKPGRKAPPGNRLSARRWRFSWTAASGIV